jgi:hypothetical protein
VLPDPPDELEFTPDLFARLETDPFNPSVWTAPADDEDPEWGFETRRSILEGPAAPAQPWVEPRPRMPAGRVELHRLGSDILRNERRVWVYTPHGYDPSQGYGVLVLFDGWACVNLVPAPTILDNVIWAGRLAPLVALVPDSLDQETRSLELPCHRPFVDFLTRGAASVGARALGDLGRPRPVDRRRVELRRAGGGVRRLRAAGRLRLRAVAVGLVRLGRVRAGRRVPH